ncbi:MAG: penicillin-binding protein 1C [Gemmatimonadales bacterium]
MKRFLRRLVITAATLAAMAAAWIGWPLPDALLAPARTESLALTDRHGVLLRSTRAGDGSLTQWVPLAALDPDLPRAFVAVEDRRFYQHHGIDLRAVARAARDNLSARRVVSGASTITMQLARLLRPMGRGWSDKLVQSLWALRLDAHLSKSVILEQYLNRVPLGQGAVGVAPAMRLYFGASAGQASLGQAAMLAALARAPSSQNPLVDPATARVRRLVGLAALQAQGYASEDEVVRASLEPVVSAGAGRPFLAPHFTSHLLQEAEQGGRRLSGSWRTTLDLALQTELESEVRQTVAQLATRGGRQAAVVVLDNHSGEILAWVGSPDFWADTAGQVDMVISARQPGSALKPFLYAMGFDRGITAATVLADVAKTYQTAGGPYHPRNYDREFHGPVRAREALASSYNVPAVELADRIGYASLLHGLLQAGFASLSRPPEFYGLGLALGNGDVTLLELANGYRALAHGGEWSMTQSLTDEPGAAATRRVVSPRAAALVLDVLADPVARVPGFGISTPFDWPFRAAAKTGTSRHFTDNWAAATTANFTVAVWVGNFSGQPMEGVSGITGAGPLLHRAVLLTANRYPPGDLARPADLGLVPVTVCRVSGMRATGECPGVTEYFVPGTEPSARCHWHTGGELHLPVEFADWAASSDGLASLAQATARSIRPRRYDSASVALSHSDPSLGAPRLTIVSPVDGDRYLIPPGVAARYATIALRAAGGAAGQTVHWYIDDRPTSATRWPLVPGNHRVRAVAGPQRAEVEIVVE